MADSFEFGKSFGNPRGELVARSVPQFPEVKGWYFLNGRLYPCFGLGIYHGRRRYRTGNVGHCGIVIIVIGAIMALIGLILTPIAFTVLENMRMNVTSTKSINGVKTSSTKEISAASFSQPIALVLLILGILMFVIGIPVNVYCKKKLAEAKVQFREHPEEFTHYQPTN